MLSLLKYFRNYLIIIPKFVLLKFSNKPNSQIKFRRNLYFVRSFAKFKNLVLVSLKHNNFQTLFFQRLRQLYPLFLSTLAFKININISEHSFVLNDLRCVP